MVWFRSSVNAAFSECGRHKIFHTGFTHVLISLFYTTHAEVNQRLTHVPMIKVHVFLKRFSTERESVNHFFMAYISQKPLSIFQISLLLVHDTTQHGTRGKRGGIRYVRYKTYIKDVSDTGQTTITCVILFNMIPYTTYLSKL